jgi:hypothetical protein
MFDEGFHIYSTDYVARKQKRVVCLCSPSQYYTCNFGKTGSSAAVNFEPMSYAPVLDHI